MKLGKREIEALTCPAGRKDRLVFDDALPGFGVRVTASGSKTFLFQYRQGKAVHRLQLGRCQDISPAAARKLALDARARVGRGGDPVAERKALRKAAEAAHAEQLRQAEADAFTLSALVDRWVELGLQNRSATHRKEAPRAIRSCFPALVLKPADQITLRDAQKAVDAIALTRPVMARRARDYAAAAYSWALARNLVAGNPFAAVVVEGGSTSRDCVLSDIELGEAWRAAGELGAPFDACIRILILTLQRRSEVAGMRWDELAPNLAAWTVPAARAKNGKAHTVHLSAPARAILAELRDDIRKPRKAQPGASPTKLRRFPGSALVFTTNGRTPLSGFERARTRLHAKIIEARGQAAPDAAKGRQNAGKSHVDVPALGWRLHDFRRTGVTVLASLGVPTDVADRLLNHVSGTKRGVKAVYQRYEFDPERRKALEQWAKHVLRVAAAEASKNELDTTRE